MKREFKGLEFKDFQSLDKKEKGMFEGILVGFDNIDHGDDVIEKGAMSRTLAEWAQKGQLPPVQWNHDDDNPVGSHLEAKPDGDYLYVKGKLWVENPTDAVRKAYNVTTSNGPKSMSVGFYNKRSTKSVKNGRNIRTIHDLDWVEGSILSYGMNDRAVILSAKSMFVCEDGMPCDIRQMEQLLRDGGLSQRQAKAFLADGYRGLTRDVSNLVYDESAIRDMVDRMARLNQQVTDYNLSTKESAS